MLVFEAYGRTEKGGEVGMTWRITRKDHTPDGVEVEVLVGFTDDQAEIGCIMDEDRHKIDWDAEYKVDSETA